MKLKGRVKTNPLNGKESVVYREDDEVGVEHCPFNFLTHFEEWFMHRRLVHSEGMKAHVINLQHGLGQSNKEFLDRSEKELKKLKAETLLISSRGV